MPCVSGCLRERCACATGSNCIIRIRSLYRGGFEFKISAETTGKQCILQAIQTMAIPEDGACFFGLQHEVFGEKYWLDNDKSVFAQLNATATPCKLPGEKRLYVILLRIRFFGVSEAILDNDTFRNFLYYQLKTDFAEGKLTRNAAEMTSLAAYLLHIGSLTIVAHALPTVEFERKLASVLPKQILSVKTLVPYVRLALKVVSSLTVEQTKQRFISQCQLLPHYGVEKFTATLLTGEVPYLICFSCSGLIVERSRVFSKNIIEWDSVTKISAKSQVLQIEFHPRLKRCTLYAAFSTPEGARRACDSGTAQQKMTEKFQWKTLPGICFQPLVHVPHGLLQFDGESYKLSEAIKDIFARSSDDLYRVKPQGYVKENGRGNSTFFPYASEANLYSHADYTLHDLDAFSLRSSTEESTLPLIYGSILAQSTPVLRHHSSVQISRVNCASTANLPHKKRLAASRPLVNCAVAMDQSVSLFFSSQPSINQSDWTTATISRQDIALSNPHLTRRISEAEVATRTKNVEAEGQTEVSNYTYLAESDRCSSLVFPRSISSEIADMKASDIHASKFKSECVLDKKTQALSVCPSSPGDLEESADDLTALPSKANYFQAKTLPASFKRRTLQTSRIICLELIQKLHNQTELDQEYHTLPPLIEKNLGSGAVTVDLGLPVRYLVCPILSKNDFENEDFWANSSNIVVILDTKFILEEGNQKSKILALFQSDVATGEYVALGHQVFLSLFSVNRSPCFNIFGVHVKSPKFISKTVWLFGWVGEISSRVLQNFASFVDEIVATEVSGSPRHSPLSTVTVSSSNSYSGIYICAHILLRLFRVPNYSLTSPSSSSSTKSVFDTVSTVRRILPETIVSLEEYAFLYELLLQWLEKPPRLI